MAEAMFTDLCVALFLTVIGCAAEGYSRKEWVIKKKKQRVGRLHGRGRKAARGGTRDTGEGAGRGVKSEQSVMTIY